MHLNVLTEDPIHIAFSPLPKAHGLILYELGVDCFTVTLCGMAPSKSPKGVSKGGRKKRAPSNTRHGKPMVISEKWTKLPMQKVISDAKNKEEGNSSVRMNPSSLDKEVVNKTSPARGVAGSSGERTAVLSNSVAGTAPGGMPSGGMLRSGTAMRATRRPSGEPQTNAVEKGKLVQRLLDNDRHTEEEPSTSSADIISRRDDRRKILNKVSQKRKSSAGVASSIRNNVVNGADRNSALQPSGGGRTKHLGALEPPTLNESPSRRKEMLPTSKNKRTTSSTQEKSKKIQKRALG